MCSALLESLGQSPCALSVVFVGPSRIRQLNRQYRGRDYATDVLSFFYPGEIAGGNPLLGDLVICLEVARAQASRWNTSFEKEVRKLLVHGLLHLLGHDHEGDRGEMHRLQRTLLRRQAATQAQPLLAGARGDSLKDLPRKALKRD